MATEQVSKMDSMFQGMTEDTIHLALKMAQMMEGKTKQDVEAMLERINKSKPSDVDGESNNVFKNGSSINDDENKTIQKEENVADEIEAETVPALNDRATSVESSRQVRPVVEASRSNISDKDENHLVVSCDPNNATEDADNDKERCQRNNKDDFHDDVASSSDDILPVAASNGLSSLTELSESASLSNLTETKKEMPQMVTATSVVNSNAQPNTSEKATNILPINKPQHDNRHSGFDHSKASSVMNQQRGEYEEFPSLPAEIREPLKESSFQATVQNGSMNESSRPMDQDQETPTITSSTANQKTVPDMSNAMISANTMLPSMPLFYQPHIVMKDNVPVLMLKPVIAAKNTSNEVTQLINLTESPMVFPLSQKVLSDGLGNESIISSGTDDNNTEAKLLETQLPSGYSTESDLDEQSSTKSQEAQTSWTTVDEEKTSQSKNPFLDDCSPSISTGIPGKPGKPGNSSGQPVPSSFAVTSSNPFNSEASPSKPQGKSSSRTDFKTIPKSMLASQAQPRGPLVSQMSDNSRTTRVPPNSQVRDNSVTPRGPLVSPISGGAATPRGPLVSQIMSDNTVPGGPSQSQHISKFPYDVTHFLNSDTASREPPVSQQNGSTVDENNALGQSPSTNSMMTLLEVDDNQRTNQTTQFSTTDIPSLSSSSSNFTLTNISPSVWHDSNSTKVDPPASNVAASPSTGSKKTAETKPKMPGHVAPYWVPDNEVFKCAYCHLKFNLIRRKHHCRGCGKIFCSNCCSQLARLSYLQYQIGRICITCTNVIKETRKKKKSNSSHTGQASPMSSAGSSSPTPSSPSSPGLISNPSQPHTPGSRQTRPTFEPMPIPISNSNVQHSPGRPIDISQHPAVAVAAPGQSSLSHPINQSESSVSQDMTIMSNQSISQSQTSSVFRLPARPAGRVVSWRGESFASRLIAQDRRKALAKDLRDLPNGVTMQLSDDLQVIVRKFKVQSSPLVQAWCCNSVGLKTYNHQEIGIHFKIRPKEDVIPEEILRMYKVILDLVKLGNSFQHSNFLAFKSSFLGTSDNAALIFASSTLVRQLKALGESKQHRLYGILVKRSELEYAQHVPTRFLLRLGQETNCFPFPILNSRDRASVYDGVEPNDIIYSTSVALNNHLKNIVPEAIIPGLVVFQEDSKVVLQLPIDSQPTLENFLNRLIVKTNQTATVPLVTALDVNIDQYKVYHQSIHTDEISLQKHVSLFRNPHTRQDVKSVTGLGFILLLLGAKDSPVLEQRGKLVDDGVIVHLSETHTHKLRQCIHERQNCHFYLGDHFEILYFQLRWIQDSNNHPRTSEPGAMSLPQEPQNESSPGSATIDVRHSGHSSELKKIADARLGDVLIIVRMLEQRIKRTCAQALKMHADKMKVGETKEVILRLSLRDGLKKWSIGPAHQPMGLIRSLQMALYDVKLSDLGDACIDITFDVTIIKQFDLIAQQYEKDLAS